jgi:hypothetical protein
MLCCSALFLALTSSSVSRGFLLKVCGKAGPNTTKNPQAAHMVLTELALDPLARHQRFWYPGSQTKKQPMGGTSDERL